MIGYVINYKDPDKRKSMPSGLLIVHPGTKHIVAIGSTPLSKILVERFTSEMEFVLFSKIQERSIVRSGPFDPEGFERTAPLWFDHARFQFVKIAVLAPLSSFVPIALDLSAAYNKEPFEKIQLVSGASI